MIKLYISPYWGWLPRVSELSIAYRPSHQLQKQEFDNDSNSHVTGRVKEVRTLWSLPRDALVQSAVSRLHVVSPPVTLVDQDHMLEILETNCADN